MKEGLKMNFDSLHYPYPSRRTVVYAKNGMVATANSLAAQAGLDIIKSGGNAIDAAIATAACLTVVEPTSNGIGGDAFAIIWTKGKIYGMNSSGPSPRSISGEELTKKGLKEMPKFGLTPVTVPGAPGAWASLSNKFGKLPLSKVLEPAIKYAEEGYPISPTVAYYWDRAFKSYSKALSGEEFKYWFDTFVPKGRAPRAGEIWSSKDHAKTLMEIGETNGESFYSGNLADKIDDFSKKYNGYIRKEDLASFEPLLVHPMKVNYRGYDVWELPPNGQGLVALVALNLLKKFDFTEKDSVRTYHKQIEAIKLAFEDCRKCITDPEKMKAKVEDLLSDSYADEKRKLISDVAYSPIEQEPSKGGTVYLAAADGDGNMISYIQSNYMGFGSGIVIPGTGIALQNRGHNFSLDPSHCNYLEPSKRTYHTIIPGFITKNDTPVGPFGVMGGFMQPQGHLQIVMNTIDFQLNPQAALDAPRWQWIKGREIEVEHSFPHHIAEDLFNIGHNIKYTLSSGGYGRGEIIWRDASGVLCGGTEPRADGSIASY